MSNDISKSIRVSLSTDAIVYLPFYLAYFGDDFKETPYGRVNVQIVGLNDVRFIYEEEEEEELESKVPLKKVDSPEATTTKSEKDKKRKNARLRGDAFMSLDVLYGIADVGLGDVGFVSILRDEVQAQKFFTTDKDSKDKSILEKYVELLNSGMITNNIDLTTILDKKNESDRTSFFIKKINNDTNTKTDLKIVGGLIRKPPLKLLLKAPNKDENKDKNFIRSIKDKQDKQTQSVCSYPSNLDEKIITVFSYPKPSTSYHYTTNFIKTLKNVKWNYNIDEVDFGEELKADKINETTGCLSCDFVALRYINKNEKDNRYKELALVDDWTCVNENILWSGFIFDEEKYKKDEDVFRAFFYAIDKCMFEINQFLNDDNGPGLHYYIKSKLTKGYRWNDVFRVLIADETISKEIDKKRENPKKTDIELDKIIGYFVKDLFYCKKIGFDSNFYYQSLNMYKQPQKRYKQNDNTLVNDNTFVQEEHIKKIAELRNSWNDNYLENCIKYDIMEDWYKQEIKINKIKTGKISKYLHRIYLKDYVRSLTVIISLITTMSLLKSFFDIQSICEWSIHKGWAMVIFLGGGVIGLWLLIEWRIIRKFDLLNKEKYVINKNRKKIKLKR